MRASLALAIAAATLLTACGRGPAPAGVAVPGRTPGAQAAASQALRAVASQAGWAVTAESVAAAADQLGAVTPPVPGAGVGLTGAGALGELGPLGAYGPLGMLGPLGSNAWNPTKYMDLVGGWDGWARQLTQHGGPLSERGPLGPDGPLGASYAGLPALGGLAAHLAAGGLWTALGPVGPLGALGPLGPLGPMGAHGFKRDGFGRYVDGRGQVQRTVMVPYAGQARRYELVERYPADTAAQLTDNDTSFLAEGAIDEAGEGDRFALTSAEAQYVTFLVVPEKQLDDFDLTVRDDAGQPVARSASRALIDFVQVRAKAGERFTAEVTRRAHGHVLRATYRLVVTGSTRHVPASAIRGPHQRPRG